MKKMKPSKRHFLTGFFAVVAFLTLVRHAVPSVADATEAPLPASAGHPSPVAGHPSPVARHRIRGVRDYRREFPDSQAVQIVSANRWGVRPVRNRADAEQRKSELVYVGESPYYHVDRLTSSIPYLVPRAAVLLQDIGRSFHDSLYQKGLPPGQLIVTSVMRSMDDVARLQRHNPNATDNSCHLYGTTVDISYNRYQPVGQRQVRNDTLKWVLSEVLRDKRREGRCYVKYEVKQGCFHMTVR